VPTASIIIMMGKQHVKMQVKIQEHAKPMDCPSGQAAVPYSPTGSLALFVLTSLPPPPSSIDPACFCILNCFIAHSLFLSLFLFLLLLLLLPFFFSLVVSCH
jgi:hypothetical protein